MSRTDEVHRMTEGVYKVSVAIDRPLPFTTNFLQPYTPSQPCTLPHPPTYPALHPIPA